MKMNVFGLKDNTSGQNLMRAIEECDQAIGILPYNYDAMREILDRALTPVEFDVICRGLGIDCQRQKQKDIAKEFNVKESEVSRIAHVAIGKLQASPYKVQLEKLVPTVQEISDMILRLKTVESDAEELKKTKRRLEGVTNQLKKSEESRKQLEADNARLSYENEQAAKKLADSRAEFKEQQARVAKLTRRSVDEKARVGAIIEAFCDAVAHLEEGFHHSVEETMKSLTGIVANAKTAMCLEELNLSKEALDALNRVGIVTVADLCKMTFRGLTSMVGKKHASEIRDKLQDKGLCLAG